VEAEGDSGVQSLGNYVSTSSDVVNNIELRLMIDKESG
jgi:hypothetical protein